MIHFALEGHGRDRPRQLARPHSGSVRTAEDTAWTPPSSAKSAMISYRWTAADGTDGAFFHKRNQNAVRRSGDRAAKGLGPPNRGEFNAGYSAAAAHRRAGGEPWAARDPAPHLAGNGNRRKTPLRSRIGPRAGVGFWVTQEGPARLCKGGGSSAKSALMRPSCVHAMARA
jgi:hypothetical protein